MEPKNLFQYIPCSAKVTDLLGRATDLYAMCRIGISALAEKAWEHPVALWFDEHRNRIALLLHMIWLVGCVYWFYSVVICDVRPRTDIGLALSDSRDAMVILFFGALALFFALFFVCFVIKLFYNLFRDGVESMFPTRWHSIVKPVSYLIILNMAFSFTGTVKMAGLTAYYQVSHLIHTSQQQQLIIRAEIPEDIEEKIAKLLELVGTNERP